MYYLLRRTIRDKDSGLNADIAVELLFRSRLFVIEIVWRIKNNMAKGNLSFKVDGRFYYGWVMLFCGFMSMFICYVIKVNCFGLFYTPIIKEWGITRTAFTQLNTFMTVTMMISSLFIGKIYKKFPIKYVLSVCCLIASLCFVGMSRATAVWQLWLLGAIQGIGWSGATNLPVTIMVSNWFGPKVKGTAMSIGMLGSGAGALVWPKVINKIIANNGWRGGYLAMAVCVAVMIPIALLLAVNNPSQMKFSTRVGDLSEDELKKKGATGGEKAGITGRQALGTARWWCQWCAGALTMVGAAFFSAQFVNYYEEIFTGETARQSAVALYSTALGTLILGKFLLGAVTDLIHIKRTAVIAPICYAGVFICMLLSESNMTFSKVLVPVYMIAGALPSVIPFLIISYNFGDKEYGVMSGWMNIAGNVGQILGPTIAAIVYDRTGSYRFALIIFTILMFVVALLYFVSTRVSKKKIAKLGYVPAN